MKSSNLEIKNQIRAWWDDADAERDYDRVQAHGVHSEQEKEMWRNALTQLLGTRKGDREGDREGEGLKILDVGTGTGFLALLLAEMGHDVTGADFSKNKLESAKEKEEEKGRRTNIPVKFVVEDAEALSFADDLFDAVVSRHLIWTLADPEAAFREWKRVTKPGGKVVVDVPGRHSHLGEHHFGEEIGRELPFYNGADPEEIVRMLEDAGLVNVVVQGFKKSGDRFNFLVVGERSDNRVNNSRT